LSKEELEKIYLKVLDFASYKPRSERELNTKIDSLLKRFKLETSADSAEAHEVILDRLRELDLLSDATVRVYVQSFINSSKPRGPRTIEQFLVRKGFDYKQIQQELDKVSEEIWLNFALSEGTKKLRSYKDPKTRKNKLLSYLYSKGYSQNTIGVAVDTLLGVK
jgi:SOS response regulatory protein OraA/RecX